MVEPLFEFFQATPLALVGLFLLLLLCGLGLPLPEDVVLVTTGLLSGHLGKSWALASLVMYAGVLGGDSIAFAIGRRYGIRVLSYEWAHRLFPQKKRHLVEKLFGRYGSFVFFVARFLPGLRAWIFCIAGAMRASFGRFLLFDGLAAMISVPLWVWLGHFLWRKFGDDIDRLFGEVSRAQSYTLWITLTLAAILAFGVWRLWRRARRAS